jgi:hypothetical protein
LENIKAKCALAESDLGEQGKHLDGPEIALGKGDD